MTKISGDGHWSQAVFGSIGSCSDLAELAELVENATHAVQNGDWQYITVHIVDDYGDYRVVLEGRRRATPEEIRISEQRDKDHEEYERQEYKRLKAKFDSISPEQVQRIQDKLSKK